jgi:hypothetical protein
MIIILVRRLGLLWNKLNEGLAFLASFAIHAYREVNNLRRMSGALGNKSAPRNHERHC